MKKTLFIFLALLILMSCCICSSASYSLGISWDNTPCIITWNCNFTTTEREAVRAAMQAWNSLTNSNGVSAVTSYLSTYITSPNYVQYGYLTDGSVAKTIPNVDSNQHITDVYITLSLFKSWSTTGESTKFDIQSVVQHELGHAIGIAHCHESGSSCSLGSCPSNVMSPNLHAGTIRTTFTSYDTAAYDYVY